MATGITFMGDDNKPGMSKETAEAPTMSTRSDGPIQSPVDDGCTSTASTDSQQDYGDSPKTSGPGEVVFMDIESTK